MEKKSIAIGGEDEADLAFPPSNSQPTFTIQFASSSAEMGEPIKKSTDPPLIEKAEVGLEACQFG